MQGGGATSDEPPPHHLISPDLPAALLSSGCVVFLFPVVSAWTGLDGLRLADGVSCLKQFVGAACGVDPHILFGGRFSWWC